VNAIDTKIHDYINFASVEHGPSGTFVPFFDATLAEQQKQNLINVPVSSQIEELVKNLQFTNTTKTVNNPKEPKATVLIKNVPDRIGKSEILNDIQISELVDELPSMLKMATWHLLY